MSGEAATEAKVGGLHLLDLVVKIRKMTQSVFWTKQFFRIDFDVFCINLMFVYYAMHFFFSQGKNCHKKIRLIQNHQN